MKKPTLDARIGAIRIAVKLALKERRDAVYWSNVAVMLYQKQGYSPAGAISYAVKYANQSKEN